MKSALIDAREACEEAQKKFQDLLPPPFNRGGTVWNARFGERGLELRSAELTFTEAKDLADWIYKALRIKP